MYPRCWHFLRTVLGWRSLYQARLEPMDGQGHVLVAASRTDAASRLCEKSAHVALAGLWHAPLPAAHRRWLPPAAYVLRINQHQAHLDGHSFRAWAWHPDVFHVFCPCRGFSSSRTGLASRQCFVYLGSNSQSRRRMSRRFQRPPGTQFRGRGWQGTSIVPTCQDAQSLVDVVNGFFQVG